ncbi:MAG: SufS family cysteine desulfurase [Bdellovibrionales bacterium]|nr:SufS family cysteine desulfurase [Bdellovibrionales bacterium]
MSIDQAVRDQFPQLQRRVRDRRLVYLDSAATTLKPMSVIEAVRRHMSEGAANVHRGAHFLSDEATEQFEHVRELARRFFNAESKNEIVITRGTTDGLNLLAHTLGSRLKEGDEILLSQMEHHSNIVPWQLAALRHRAVVRFVPVLDNGALDLKAFKSMLSAKTKIVSLVHLSNALGTLNPLAELFTAAKSVGAITVADAAQSASVTPLDVRALGADFVALSAHKMFGPTGVGLLYGKMSELEKLPPYQGGGSMISEVREDGVDFLAPPHRFEAGTPPIAEVMGLGAAMEFILEIGYEKLKSHERAIMAAAEKGLNALGGIRRIGQAPEHSHVLSFLIDGHHPSDVGAILDEQGVAVRAGHHCCQPLMRRFGIPGTVRASFSVYTSEEDVRDFVAAVKKAKDLLA